MTKGLPASGKSTWAKDQVARSNGKIKRINKDDLRDMIDAGVWSKRNEKDILKVRDKLIQHYLSNDCSVIVDDTNLAPKHQAALEEIAQGFQCNFEIRDFLDVPLDECIRRDLARPVSVGERVIKSMYNTFLKPKPDVAQYQAPEHNEDLPNCIIVDIDGTLAHMNGRSPYDYTKVKTDVVDEQVRDIIWRYAQRDPNETPSTYIMVVSGREDSCKADTEQWLQDNQIPHDELHMRKTGDLRNDTIIKQEIYEEWIKDRYNVRFVLDDRNRVVDMWRNLGLKVLQVAPGDF
jgi:predicted kinase